LPRVFLTNATTISISAAGHPGGPGDDGWSRSCSPARLRPPSPTDACWYQVSGSATATLDTTAAGNYPIAMPGVTKA